jgi:TonB family protein
MNKYIYTILLVVSVILCHAQTNDVDGNADKVYTIVEEMPKFPGGETQLLNYVAHNVKYPATARENGIQGKVYVAFVIDTIGSVIEARVLRGIGGGCDEEALRVVNSMPKWAPGTQDGKPVRVQYNLPINFVLKGEEHATSKESIPFSFRIKDTSYVFDAASQ